MKRVQQFLSSKILTLLLTGETALLRLWFGIASLAFGIWISFDPNFSEGHTVAIAMATLEAQIVMFFVHGCAMIYGAITSKFSRIQLFLECFLGIFLWVGLGLAEMVQQQAPGPMIAGGGIALFLLIRYPTHYNNQA